MQKLSARSLSCLIVVFLSIILAGCYKKYDMQFFSPPDDLFVVSVPMKLETKTQTVSAPEGSVTITTHSAKYDDILYQVSLVPLLDKQARLTNNHEKILLQNARDRLLADNPGWRLVKEVGDRVDSRDSGYGMKLVLAAGPKHTATFRIFVSNGHALQISAIVPNKTTYNQGLYSERFLESFKWKKTL